jgi:opacity protein-like surface antigen
VQAECLSVRLVPNTAISQVRGGGYNGTECQAPNEATALRGAPGSTTASADVKMSGAAAFGMLYLPVPVVSLYAKAGLARLQTTSNVALFLPGVGTCTINNPNCAWFSRRNSVTNAGLAAGAGAQLKLGAWALRAEYERFNVAGGNPGLASLATTWTF